jgi:adenosylhomocysteine nucleosidase
MKDTVFIVALREETGNSDEILGCPVIYSGPGKINSSIAACQAISRGFKNIINIGSCGSLKLEPGEIIKIGKVYQDIDFTPLCQYGETFLGDGSIYIEMDKSSDFTCFTTDYFFDCNQIGKYSENYIRMVNECSIFDMECFAIAKSCISHSVNFNSYKWVSDDGHPEEWEKNQKDGFERAKEIIKNEYKEKGF